MRRCLLLVLALCLFSSNGSAALMTYQQITSDSEIDLQMGQMYPVIVTSPSFPMPKGFICGVIGFLKDDPNNRLDYVFKSWDPINGQCDFHNDAPVELRTDSTCLNPSLQNNRFLWEVPELFRYDATAPTRKMPRAGFRSLYFNTQQTLQRCQSDGRMAHRNAQGLFPLIPFSIAGTPLCIQRGIGASSK